MKISVLVPVYRYPKQLKDMVLKLKAMDFENRDIIAVVDGEMTEEIARALEDLGDAVSVIFPDQHLGKAEALNRAVREVQTDVLLFFDNDIILPDDPGFLKQIAADMNSADIVDIPKEVVIESVYSAMIAHEYQGLAISSLLFSKLSRRSPALIGAAFAVKKELFDRMGGFRKVVHEDGDFGARAFRLHATYTYDLKLKVKTTMPNTARDWFVQRKRWTLINVLWFKDNILYLLKSMLRQPSLLLTLAGILLPALLSILIFFVFREMKLTFITPLLFMLEQPFIFLAGAMLWLTHNSLFSEGLISTLVGFFCTLALYGGFSAAGKFRFSILSFLPFYFLYMPLLAVANVVMFIAQLNATKIRLDWKT